jgi:predicted glycosyltransferase
MSRILVYSPDSDGLGHITRMLAIGTHMAGTLEDASVLMVSGSPLPEGLRLAPRVHHIKLPSVARKWQGDAASRSLRPDSGDLIELRANLIRGAVVDFRPDMILIDREPFGIENELEAAIGYAKLSLPRTSLVLILRDILDSREATMRAWKSGKFTSAIERFYDRVLVLGTPAIFDMRREYDLPASVCEKVRYCGYVRLPRSPRRRDTVRRDLGLQAGEQLVLVTPGGGPDGAAVLRAYVEAIPSIHALSGVRSLIVTGPGMDAADRQPVENAAATQPGVEIREFTPDMMSYFDAADVVVCRGDYNTLCEVATLRKRAVVIPRVRPVQEQRIRAERLARAGIVTTVLPDTLDADRLAPAVLNELRATTPEPSGVLDLGALRRVTRHVQSLLLGQRAAATGRRWGIGRAAIMAATEFAVSARLTS